MTRNDSNPRILTTLIIAMALIVVTMIVSVFVATRRPIVVVLPGTGTSGQPGTLPAPIAGGETAGTGEAAPEIPAEVSVSTVPTAPSVENPLDPFWEKVAATEIALQPQQVAEPALTTASVSKMKVQAVRDANRYLWRLSWAQATPCFNSDFGQFSDAVAIQFPLVDGAPYTMGGPNMPVAMFYWKAIWQKDQDEGFQDAAVTKPNAYNDFYWFAPVTGPISADKLIADDTAKQWMIATASGNPMADYHRKCPMEGLIASGFGSTTHVPDAPGLARGKWENGTWFVVFEHPISESDELVARFKQNPQQQLIAFAVWDGTAENRGGKKHISNWVPMRIN